MRSSGLLARAVGAAFLAVLTGACVLLAPTAAAMGETLAQSLVGTEAAPAEVAALAAAFAQVPALAGATFLVWRIEVARAASQARFLETIERLALGRPA